MILLALILNPLARRRRKREAAAQASAMTEQPAENPITITASKNDAEAERPQESSAV